MANIFEGGRHNFHIVFKRIFFSRTNLKLNEKQKRHWGGPGACSPGHIFGSLHAVMAILVLFELISAKFCLNFLTLMLSVSPNMMHFVRTFSIMRTYGVRLIAIEEARNYRKIVYIKNIVENGWWEDA